MLNDYKTNDLKRIQDPNQWPQNPILPLVNRKKRSPGNMPQCAFLVDGHGAKLYVKNMFELEDGPLLPQLINLETIQFDSLESMLEEGWEVD